MKVAIAGSSNVAKYLVEELPKHGHQVIQLTRCIKPDQKAIEQRQTDYSITSLVSVLEDCDALASTIADFLNPPAAIKINLDMLEACRQYGKCKTSIPSEWTCNVEDHPEQLMFLVEHNKIIHERLKQEKSIRWTIICNSWFADYVAPQKQRTQPIDFTFVRNIAKAVAVLFNSEELWEPYTYLSGDQLTWNELFAIMKRSDPQWTSRKKSLADTLRSIMDTTTPEDVYTGHFEILSYSGASTFPKEKVQRQRAKYFSHPRFRTIQEVWVTAAESPDEVI